MRRGGEEEKLVTSCAYISCSFTGQSSLVQQMIKAALEICLLVLLIKTQVSHIKVTP